MKMCENLQISFLQLEIMFLKMFTLQKCGYNHNFKCKKLMNKSEEVKFFFLVSKTFTSWNAASPPGFEITNLSLISKKEKLK